MDWYPADELLPICEKCPVFEKCHAYALAAKPDGGIWAGMRFDTNGKRIQWIQEKSRGQKFK
jgi:hypothetical protein